MRIDVYFMMGMRLLNSNIDDMCTIINLVFTLVTILIWPYIGFYKNESRIDDKAI